MSLLPGAGLATFGSAFAGVPDGKNRRRRPPPVAIVLLFLAIIGLFWIAGRQSPWSPNYQAPPLPAEVIRATEGPVYSGAQLFHSRACLNCHRVEGHGGRRGPDLTSIAARKSPDEMRAVIRSGGENMPAYDTRLTAQELNDLIAFLKTRQGDSRE